MSDAKVYNGCEHVPRIAKVHKRELAIFHVRFVGDLNEIFSDGVRHVRSVLTQI